MSTVATPLTTVVIAEKEIRSLAGEITNRATTRRNHPTYGVTKRSLQDSAARLDGMVALYAVITEQANFNSSPAAFRPNFLNLDGSTTHAVEVARTAVREA